LKQLKTYIVFCKIFVLYCVIHANPRETKSGRKDAKWCILLHFGYKICLVKTLNRRFLLPGKNIARDLDDWTSLASPYVLRYLHALSHHSRMNFSHNLLFKVLTRQILYPNCSRMHHFASFLPLLVSRGLACMTQYNTNILQNKKYVSEENTTEY
jgi:hypothetical protein